MASRTKRKSGLPCIVAGTQRSVLIVRQSSWLQGRNLRTPRTPRSPAPVSRLELRTRVFHSTTQPPINLVQLPPPLLLTRRSILDTRRNHPNLFQPLNPLQRTHKLRRHHPPLTHANEADTLLPHNVQRPQDAAKDQYLVWLHHCFALPGAVYGLVRCLGTGLALGVLDLRHPELRRLLPARCSGDETYHDRKAPQSERPTWRSRPLRLLGLERHANFSLLESVSRPFVAITKPPVLIITVFYFLNFAWTIGVNATLATWLAKYYHFDGKQTGETSIILF